MKWSILRFGRTMQLQFYDNIMINFSAEKIVFVLLGTRDPLRPAHKQG